MVFAGGVVEIQMKPEIPVFRRHLNNGIETDGFFALAPPGDKGSHGQDAQSVAAGEHFQIGQAGHLAVVAHDFADDRDGLEAGEPGEVEGGLGMAGPPQDAAGDTLQRENVAGTDEIAGRGGVVGQQADGPGPIEGADAGGDALTGVHRYGECGPVAVLFIQRHHAAEPQAAEPLFLHGHADQPPAVGGHEIDPFRRDEFAGGHQVAFVLPVFIIHDQQQAPGAENVQGFFHRAEDVAGIGCRHEKTEDLSVFGAWSGQKPHASSSIQTVYCRPRSFTLSACRLAGCHRRSGISPRPEDGENAIMTARPAQETN